MANPKWSGMAVVNPLKDKQSHVVLTDDQGRFTDKFKVKNDTATDDNGITYEAKVCKRVMPKRLEIRLKSKATKSIKEDTTTATLSIVLTDTATMTDIMVDPIKVDYTNDADACH